MRSDDAPENWQKRGRRQADLAPPSKVSVGARLAMFLLFLVFIGGGLCAYVLIGQSSGLGETLPMPRALRTVSPAHEDLLPYGRALNEIAVEAGARFSFAGPANAPAAKRLLDRLARQHKTGRDLEPQLTREESRALVAFQQAEKLLQQFLASVTKAGALDPADLRNARAQLAHASDISRGKPLNELVASKVRGLGALDDVKSAGGRLRPGAGEE